MTEEYVIGIDCSTTASKAIIWDRYGNAVSEGRSPIQLFNPCQGWYEQSALDWWDSTLHAIKQACQNIDKTRLAAISITHQRETFVPVDKHNAPLYNGIVWMDERCRTLLPSLEILFGKEEFHRITGKPLSVNLTIGKIAWLKQFLPDIFSRTEKYLDVHAYLVSQLTGNYATGWGCADPTGMFDMLQNDWAVSLVESLGVRVDQMPKAYPPGEIIGSVSAQASEITGIPKGLPVVAGVGDGQMCGLGVNITQSGEAYLALGTSVVSGLYGDHYITHPSFRTMYGGIPNTYIYETALLGGGFILNWFYKHFSTTDVNYELEATKLTRGSDGVILVPYWNSVLGPYWDPDASGIVVGWRGNHTPIHLYRAILEGIAYEQRLCTNEVERATGQKVNRFIVIGGGAQNNLWCQIFSDVTGNLIYRARSNEAAALGAGILAAYAVGWYSSIKLSANAMTRVSEKVFQPSVGNHAYYTQIFEEIYINLYPALRTYLSRLAKKVSSVVI